MKIASRNLSFPPDKWGVSFSIKQCRNFGIDPDKSLDWLLKQGFRRFRLMSYWDECQPSSNEYDFSELDKQIAKISKKGGIITLCLGVRQPRWPESHWPDWAWQLPKSERTSALLDYLSTTVQKYKDIDNIVSYQLENEALLDSFGERSEVDRQRLRREYELVRSLDADRPIIMTTSTSWGIPIRKPRPDIVGFSYYQILFNPKFQRYSKAFHKPLLDRVRGALIDLLWRRPSFIHELQLEPWGPKAIWEMSPEEQAKSMNPQQIATNIRLAKKTKLYPIDLWGGEWWYWRSVVQKDRQIWNAVKSELDFAKK